jgi:ankyrin repeat protein
MSYQNKYLKYKLKYLDLKKQIGGSKPNIATAGGGGSNDQLSMCGYCLNEINSNDQKKIILECECCLHLDCLCDSLESILIGSGQITHLDCPSKPVTLHTGTSYTHLMIEKEKITDEDCQRKMDKLIQRLKSNVENNSSVGETDKYVLLTSRECPVCTLHIRHSHGHQCHHKLKWLGCKHEFCFVCGSDKEEHECFYKGKYVGDNWSTWCKKTITEKDIDYSTGIPRDNRCGCTFCTECRVGKSCTICNGSCLVCTGIVKPGPTEILPETDRRGWYIPQSSDLINASREGDLYSVNSIIAAGIGADINKIDNDTGKTALMYASENGHFLVVQSLINAGADVNIRGKDYDKNTALLIASNKQNFDIVKSIIDAGANVNIEDRNGTTPLLYASTVGELSIVDYLINKGANIHYKHNGPLVYASRSGHLHIVDYLINRGLDINTKTFNNEDNPFSIAITEGYLGIVDSLVRAGVDVNQKYYYHNTNALIMASERGHLHIVDYLVKAGLGLTVNDTDDLGKTPLMYASEKGHLPIVDYLIKAGADINKLKLDRDGTIFNLYESNNALMYASEKGHLHIVDYLIKAGVNLNMAIGNKKITALMVISIKRTNNLSDKMLYKRAQIVQLLVDGGADINQKDIFGKTALIHALETENFSIVEALVNNKADINIKDTEGKNALYYVSTYKTYNKEFNLVSEFIDFSTSDSSQISKKEKTIRLEIIKLLKDRGGVL